jgi:hypothetical protein
VIDDRPITAASHDATIAHHDCTDRYLAERKRTLRFAQSFFHEQFIRPGHEGEG